MEIFLVRHAIAVDRSPDLADELRPLSEHGVRRFTKEVRGMQRLELGFDHVFHSPWLRAVQTAELLAPVTAGEREVTELLADDPSAELIALAERALCTQPQTQRVAFVGHEPWMAELLSLLLTGGTRLADHVPFKKGGVAWLMGDAKPGSMALLAMFPPKSLRRLDDTEQS